MESRRRLYKAGPRDNPTLSERVKHNRNRIQTARLDKFAASRKIPINESPESPQAIEKLTEITDRRQKLRAYRLQKNTAKFKQVQEQRSPFILAVPVGRWVEKREKTRIVDFGMNATPIRNALMNERVLKKSTIKDLIAKSTTKKENAFTFDKAATSKSRTITSKKKILGELDAVSNVVPNEEDELIPLEHFDLNSTFEMVPEANEEEVAKPSMQLRRSNSLPEIVPKATERVIVKLTTPPVKKVIVAKKVASQELKPFTKAQIKKPVIVRRVATTRAVKTIAPDKRIAKAPESEQLASDSVMPEAELEPRPVAQVKNATKKQESSKSMTYQLYKSSLDTQVSYLSMRIQDIMNNSEAFLATLSESQQMSVHDVVNEGKLLITDHLKKFEEFLETFERDLKRPGDPNRVTDEDVENYWYKIYDEIEQLKDSLNTIQDMKKRTLALVASLKKRRTRRTYIPDEGTPKRSKRIADNADTPKHNASCYGCITRSANKVNTPKSANKRRTTGKKSVVFENIETPKRSSSRRSTKLHKATPKRNIMRMNALNGVDDSELNFEELA